MIALIIEIVHFGFAVIGFRQFLQLIDIVNPIRLRLFLYVIIDSGQLPALLY